MLGQFPPQHLPKPESQIIKQNQATGLSDPQLTLISTWCHRRQSGATMWCRQSVWSLVTWCLISNLNRNKAAHRMRPRIIITTIRSKIQIASFLSPASIIVRLKCRGKLNLSWTGWTLPCLSLKMWVSVAPNHLVSFQAYPPHQQPNETTSKMEVFSLPRCKVKSSSRRWWVVVL